MNFWKIFSKKSKHSSDPKIKKLIKFDSLVIKLYEIDWMNYNEVVPNIEAFDSEGKLIWIIEKPTHGFHYWDMQIDEDRGQLEVDCGTGQYYTVDLKNGCIIAGRIIK